MANDPERVPIHAERMPPVGVTRLAPSPTGALHLGNARTFLVNWAMARQAGWRVVLRIEDLDTPRVKPGAIEETIETLRWLGIDWDEGPYFQAADLEPYGLALRLLASAGLAYPCALTRREIEAAASAPNERDPTRTDDTAESRYPAHLRPEPIARTFDDVRTNWRFATPAGEVLFDDAFLGAQQPDPARTVGDFVIWSKRGAPGYQLAVVVDDARQGITQVVRGSDLIDSAGRQLLLYRALGLGPEPTYTHVPLVRGHDGRRLAKRHGDTRLTAYRDRGTPSERVIGLCARWCGITRERAPMAASEFRERFTLSTMPIEDVVYTPEDEAWLTS